MIRWAKNEDTILVTMLEDTEHVSNPQQVASVLNGIFHNDRNAGACLKRYKRVTGRNYTDIEGIRHTQTAIKGLDKDEKTETGSSKLDDYIAEEFQRYDAMISELRQIKGILGRIASATEAES